MKRNLLIALFISLVLASLVFICINIVKIKIDKNNSFNLAKLLPTNTDKQVKHNSITQSPPKTTQIISIIPTTTIIKTPTITPILNTIIPAPTEEIQEWGVAKQIDEYSWTMKIGKDERMGTPEEIFLALNSYRSRHGSNPLSWNDELSQYAETRVDRYVALGETDKHEGFIRFAEEPNNIRCLGFNSIGENSSQGFILNAIHLIEWMYAGDEPHNKNQLNPKWTHVGIAVKESFTELIFGGNKI